MYKFTTTWKHGISIKDIKAFDPCGYDKFARIALESGCDFTTKERLRSILRLAGQIVGGIDFLVKHKIIENLETYRLGDNFVKQHPGDEPELTGDLYIIVSVAKNQLLMINTKGFRLSEGPIRVNDSYCITSDEFTMLTGGAKNHYRKAKVKELCLIE